MTGQIGAAAAPQATDGSCRPPEIEDFGNRIVIHPLSERVVRLAVRFELSPNQLSVLGLCSGFLAALAFSRMPDAFFVFAGLVLMMGWHVFDGADGRLARLTGQSSPLGRVIDGICDHLVFASVYLGLALYLMAQGWGPGAFVLAVAAGLSHAVQAAGYEERRQRYERRRDGRSYETRAAAGMPPAGLAGALGRLYCLAQRAGVFAESRLDRALATLDRTRTEARKLTRRRLIKQLASDVRLWSFLNANNRSVAIFVCCLLGRPDLYFLYEMIVLNAVFVALILAEPRHEAALLRRHGLAGSPAGPVELQ